MSTAPITLWSGSLGSSPIVNSGASSIRNTLCWYDALMAPNAASGNAICRAISNPQQMSLRMVTSQRQIRGEIGETRSFR